MDINYLAKGLLFGLSMAVPVGPVGLLCIRRTVTEGTTAGFLAGLGAAAADALYGAVAAFGLSLVMDALLGQQFLFRVMGGLCLIYLGLRTCLAEPRRERAGPGDGSVGYLAGFTSTFFITLSNPMTILSFTALLAALGLEGANPRSTLTFVIGVFTGSAAWWLCLSTMVGAIRLRLSQATLLGVNRLSGLVIGSFGLIALFGAGA